MHKQHQATHADPELRDRRCEGYYTTTHTHTSTHKHNTQQKTFHLYPTMTFTNIPTTPTTPIAPPPGLAAPPGLVSPVVAFTNAISQQAKSADGSARNALAILGRMRQQGVAP